MSNEIHFVNDEVARELYPVAVNQAREQVILQLAVIAGLVLLGGGLDFRRQFAWAVGMVAMGALVTASDIRWWLWLRRASPVEAYVRVQTRDDRDGGPFWSNLPLVLSICYFRLWLLDGK